MKNTNIKERLFQVGKPYWDKIIEHSFIKEMANGTLDKDKFRYYTLQDNTYLIEFSKVFALGITKSDNVEDIKSFLKFMEGALGSETENHNSFLEKIGVTKESVLNTKADIINTSYTNYMISVASLGGAAECATAVLTCNWSYEYIAKKTKDINGHNENFYCKDWYDIYLSDYFIEDVKNNIKLVEKLSENYTEKQIQHLEDIVRNCSHYEYMFWDSAYNKGQVANFARV